MTGTKIDLNNADCIQKTADLFSAKYHNICDGTVISVPYGTFDMIGVGMLLLMLFLMVGLVLFRIAMTFTNR